MSNSDTLGQPDARPQFENRFEKRIEKRGEPLSRLVPSPLPVGDGARPQFPAVDSARTTQSAGDAMRAPVAISEAARAAVAINEAVRTPIQVAEPPRAPQPAAESHRAPMAITEVPEDQLASTPAHPEPPPFQPIPEPERVASAPSDLTGPPASPPPPSPGQMESTGMQRAARLFRSAAPYVQKILPLLDGNFATAVANMLAPHPHPAPPPPPPVNLEPLNQGLADLRTQQRDLRVQIIDQNSSLKRVEDQLEMVREATDRNTLEQQELIEDLKAVGNKVNMFAILALSLLAASVLLNIVLYLRLRHG